MAQIDEWIDFSHEIDLPASAWIFPILGYTDDKFETTEKAKYDIRKILTFLNKHLQQRTFLVGQRISLADIVVATSLIQLYQRVLDNNFRQPFVSANRWFITVVNQPEFKSVVGEIKLCQKMEVAPSALVVQHDHQPQLLQPKRLKKRKSKKHQDEDCDDEPEEVEQQVKVENKNSSNEIFLDEWKRMYTNNDTRSVAIPWFWENLDKQSFSVWFGEYNYNTELQKIYMTMGLLSGYIQRLERLRKKGFGSLIIFGEDSNAEVSVCFLVSGQEFPEEMVDCDDTQYYNWRKANLDDPIIRELINDYWAWDGTFGGRQRKFNTGRTFK